MVLDDPDDRYRAPALDKGLDILEVLAQHGESLTQVEIAKELGRSPNETYRMLTTLVRRGFVLKEVGGEGYQLSLRMFTLAHRYPPMSRLIQQAQPLMRRAVQKARQSCHISIEQNGQLVIIASAEAPGNWGLSLRAGSIIGLYNTATGRVLAAFRSKPDYERLLASHELADGETLMPRKDFDAHLERVREVGCERMPSATAMGVTNVGYPILGPDGTAIAALVCPYLERIDAFLTPSIDDVISIFAEVAARLSMSTSRAGPAES